MAGEEILLNAGMDVTDLKKGAKDGEDAIKGVADEAEKSSDRGNKAFDLLGKGAMALGTGILSLGAGLIAAEKAAADEQVGMDRLYGTLANSIKGWDGNTAAIENYVSGQTKLAFQDDQVRDSLNLLVGQTHDLKKAQEEQALAMDLARAKGIDLSQATKLVMKADDESYAALGKLGIQIDKNATQEQALAAIHQATAGQAEKYANSTAGAAERIQNSMGDAFETVGHAVLGLVAGPLAGFADWIQSDAVQSGIQAAADFLQNGLAVAFQWIGDAVAAVMPIIQPFADAVMNFIGSISSGGDVLGSFGQYFNDMGAAVGNAWGIIGPALGGLLGNIISWIVDNGPSILSTLAGWAQSLWQWIVDALPTVMSTLGTLIGNVIQWGIDNGPAILATLSSWATALWQWIVDALPVVMTTLGNLISGIFQWISDNGPGILSKLAEWGGKLWQWIVDVMPTVLSTLGTLITSIWNWILDNGPTILVKLGEWALAFIGWILPMIPPLLLELGKIAVALLGWVVEMGGTLLNKLVTEWIPAMWNWITGPGGVLENIGAKLGQIATAVWNWLTTTAGDLGSKLINEWIPKVWDWITGPTGVVATIPTKLGEIATAVWTWLTTTAGDLGSKLVNEWIPKFWDWISGPTGVVATIGTKLGDIWTKITEWIGTTATNILNAVGTIGGNIVEGIKTGISNSWDAFVTWVQGLLSGLLSGVLSFFGIHSPSTVMRDQVGMQLVAGMKEGWDGAWPGFSSTVNANVKSLCDNDIKEQVRKLCDEDLPPIMKRLTDADGAIMGPLKKLTDADGVPAIMATLCDEDGAIQKPLSTLCDEDIPKLLQGSVASIKSGGAGLGQAIADGFSEAFNGAAANMLQLVSSVFDGLWGEASKRAQEIYNLMQNGTAGSGDPYAGGNSAGGTGGGGGNAYATGGRPPVGVASLVGERGPELFVPDRPGTIIPNNALKGMGGSSVSSTINIYIDGILHTPSQLSQALGAQVRISEALT